MKALRNNFQTLNDSNKIFALVFLERGICMAVRDVPSRESEDVELRLRKCDAFIEITHRITEQIGHYLTHSGRQRPDSDLFELIDELCEKVELPKLPEFAWRYAEEGFAAVSG